MKMSRLLGHTVPWYCLNIQHCQLFKNFGPAKEVIWHCREVISMLIIIRIRGFAIVSSRVADQGYAICPRSSDLFYIVSYYIKWVTTSWTHGN